MADQAVTSTSLGTLKALVTLLSTTFVGVGRNLNSPLKHFMDVSDAVYEKGQAVNIMVGAETSSALLTDGNSIVLDDTVGTGATVTLNKYRYKAFSVTNLAKALAGDAQAIVLMQQSIASFLNDIEADCLSVITSGLTNTAGSYNTTLDIDTINTAVVTLDDNKAPQPRVGLLRHDAKAWGAFIKLPQIVYGYQTGGPSPVNNANFAGPIFYNGVNFYKTQALPKATNNIDNCIVAPGSIACAMRPLAQPKVGIGCQQENFVDAESGIAFSIVYQWDGQKQAEQVIVKTLYGYTVPQVKYGVLVKS